MRLDALQPRELPGLGSENRQQKVLPTAVLPQSGTITVTSGKDSPPAVPAIADVHAAAHLIDQFLRQAGRELDFSVDEITGQTVVSVRDPATGELIRQFPSEEALRISRNLEKHGPALVSELA